MILRGMITMTRTMATKISINMVRTMMIAMTMMMVITMIIFMTIMTTITMMLHLCCWFLILGIHTLFVPINLDSLVLHFSHGQECVGVTSAFISDVSFALLVLIVEIQTLFVDGNLDSLMLHFFSISNEHILLLSCTMLTCISKKERL